MNAKASIIIINIFAGCISVASMIFHINTLYSCFIIVCQVILICTFYMMQFLEETFVEGESENGETETEH